MEKTRNNHYVPQWYQRGFQSNNINKLHFLNLDPDTKELPNGRIITMNDRNVWPTSKCFVEKDLYTTFFGSHINDEIERKLFGKIDDIGATSIRAFIGDDPSEWHNNISNFFEYIDAQKLRTPKGLSWIKKHYPALNQMELMKEMQAIRQLNSTILSESVREVISAENSNVKFLLSDHPVTTYNYDCPPSDDLCNYPDDPSIAYISTQTIFPLDMNHCIIFTNYEYAENPDTSNPRKKRINARNFGNALIRTDALIKERKLNDEDVKKINYIIKERACRYIAASEKEWLYPEQDIKLSWSELRDVLLPQKNKIGLWGGEMFIGYKDGSTHYQDAFGRTTPENKYLNKPERKKKIGNNDYCGCGSGVKYKKCCIGLSELDRPSWNILSIRERNLAFANGVINILGLSTGGTWEDVRRELSNEQVKKIHELYGYFWPIHTDILSLLPKSDKRLRAIYTGIIDVRVISKFVTSSTLYFDEVIIYNPFTNPHFVNQEFSPVDNPHSFKQQTLKNVLLLLKLLPFIESGYINLIPDVFSFNQHLLRQMFDMSKERKSDINAHQKDKILMEWLYKDDFERINSMLSEAQRKIQIRQAIPDVTELQIEGIIKYQNLKKLQDPLSLLQDDVYGKHGGQLLMMDMSPNFEALLFVSQITKSVILTDSNYRWDEIKASQNFESSIASYDWNDLANCINSFKYYFNESEESSFNLRSSGKFSKLRNILKKIFYTLQDDLISSHYDSIMKKLIREYTESHQLVMKDIGETKGAFFMGKFSCIIPKNGIVHNNVQRMLLSSGSEKHLSRVPMAIFVEDLQ